MFCDAGGDFGRSDELICLVSGFVDQELSAAQIERLDALLLASEDARRYFAEAMTLHLELCHELRQSS